MKKIILVAVLTLVIAFSANAQRFGNDVQRFGYGILLGGNISGIREDPKQLHVGSKFGFQIGAFADFYFSENVFIKGDFMFITKGAHNEATAFGVTILTDINPMYFQVPIVFGYSLNATRDINVNFSLGGYTALGIAGKSKSRFEIEGNTLIKRDESISYFKENNESDLLYLGNNNRFDYGLRFGLGIDVNKLLFFAFDFDLGLANVHNNKNIINHYSKYNYTLGLTIGYRF